MQTHNCVRVHIIYVPLPLDGCQNMHCSSTIPPHTHHPAAKCTGRVRPTTNEKTDGATTPTRGAQGCVPYGDSRSLIPPFLARRCSLSVVLKVSGGRYSSPFLCAPSPHPPEWILRCSTRYVPSHHYSIQGWQEGVSFRLIIRCVINLVVVVVDSIHPLEDHRDVLIFLPPILGSRGDPCDVLCP